MPNFQKQIKEVKKALENSVKERDSKNSLNPEETLKFLNMIYDKYFIIDIIENYEIEEYYEFINTIK